MSNSTTIRTAPRATITQPMALRGRREATSAPTPGNTSTMNANQSGSRPVLATMLSPAIAATTARRNIDHATRGAVRELVSIGEHTLWGGVTACLGNFRLSCDEHELGVVEAGPATGELAGAHRVDGLRHEPGAEGEQSQFARRVN